MLRYEGVTPAWDDHVVNEDAVDRVREAVEPGRGPDVDTTAAIRDELERIEESAKWSAQCQFEQAKQWRGINLALGLPASSLAAVSGAAALASTTSRVVAGVIALVSAAFGALLTTVNASHRTNRATAAANSYLEIQTAARQARLIDLPTATPDEARSILAELTARRDEQNKTAEPPKSSGIPQGWTKPAARWSAVRG